MAYKILNRIKETSTTTGTGTLTLDSVVAGHRSFSLVGNGNTCTFLITVDETNIWEISTGTWSTGGTLTRDTVKNSSTGSKLSLPAGNKTVTLVWDADTAQSIYDTIQSLGTAALADTSDFAAASHSHSISDTTGLQTALDGKQAAGSYAAASHTHAQSDITNLATTLSGKADSSHTHAQSDITNLTTDLAGKAAASHTHAQSDITNLTTDLAGKAAASHTHVISDVTSLQTTLDGKAASSHTHSQSDITNLTTDLAGKAASSHTHPASDISDSTSAGRTLLTAADAAAQRTALSVYSTSQVDGMVGGGTSHSILDGCRFYSSAGAPVSTSEVASTSNLYFGPYRGDYVYLWSADDGDFIPVQITEQTITLSGMTNGKVYDVFGYLSGGALVIDTLLDGAWTNNTTRAVAVSLIQGRLCRTSDKARLLGTFRATGATTTADDSTYGYVCSAINPVRVLVRKFSANSSWTSSGNGTWAGINSSNTTFRFNTVQCWDDADNWIRAQIEMVVISGYQFAIAQDASNSIDRTKTSIGGQSSTPMSPSVATFSTVFTPGYHYLQGVETTFSGTGTAYGTNGGTIGSGNFGVNSSFEVSRVK